jgi:acetylornithine deacetylase/succinyl-diaminopimelate desuccinylase-like protein
MSIEQKIVASIDHRRNEIIQLLQKLVSIPSNAGDEGALARFLLEAFQRIGLCTVINPLGDVNGVLGYDKGDGYFLLNTHLDQAEPGDMPDPYSGAILDGSKFGDVGEVIYGRGTNGQKSALAGFMMAIQTILDLQIPLKRGILLNANVFEENGGHISPEYLLNQEHYSIFASICGEHTDLRPVNRQRGMIHIPLKITGVGGHAASPEGKSSALLGMAKTIVGLSELAQTFPKDEKLGDALVSINKVSVSPNVANAIPDSCQATIDIRQPASIRRDEIVASVQAEIGRVVASQPGLGFESGIIKKKVISHTGYQAWSDGCMYPFYTPEDQPVVAELINCLELVTGVRRNTELWKISSEAGYYSSIANIPVVAFGPGEDRFTHNNIEHVRVEDVITATKVYALMIQRMCAAEI